MQHHIQTLVQHIFHKDTLEAVTVKELQQFTETYPYSGVGQLLLAKKLQDTGAPEYPEQAAKTALYFHNPVWPGWLLQEFSGSVTEDDWMPATHTARQAPRIGLALHVERETQNAERGTPDAERETQHAEPVDDYQPPWDVVKDAEITVAALTTEPQGAAEPVIDQHQPGSTGTTTFVNEETPNAERETLNAERKTQNAERETQEAEPATTIPAEPEQQPGTSFEQPATSNQHPVPSTQHPAPGNEPELVFESYHTIDYFASQGIKLKLDELPKDKLAQQLKSFTEWLRSMKRIAPTEEITSTEDIHQLSSIQRFAEHSVEAREIVTEAMAEVWAKQGNRAKAIAIYEKLSLLNPAKSAYFASRISALKAS
jgi:hypothetical protein